MIVGLISFIGYTLYSGKGKHSAIGSIGECLVLLIMHPAQASHPEHCWGAGNALALLTCAYIFVPVVMRHLPCICCRGRAAGQGQYPKPRWAEWRSTERKLSGRCKDVRLDINSRCFT